MKDEEFLLAVRQYIEETEVRFEGEWGCGRRLDALIEKSLMPDLYAEVLQRIAGPNVELSGRCPRRTDHAKRQHAGSAPLE